MPTATAAVIAIENPTRAKNWPGLSPSHELIFMLCVLNLDLGLRRKGFQLDVRVDPVSDRLGQSTTILTTHQVVTICLSALSMYFRMSAYSASAVDGAWMNHAESRPIVLSVTLA